MRWPSFLRRGRQNFAGDALDIDEVLAVGLRDRDAARRSIDQLRQERHRVEREQRAIHRQFRRVTPRQVRTIVHSDRAAPEMEVYQLSQAIRDANDASGAAERSDQLAEIEARLNAIDNALARLNAYLREQR